MNRHELKCWPEPFIEIARGAKRHEVRRDDRDFQPDDHVILREWDPATSSYSGCSLDFRIGYVSRGAQFGLPDALCVFTLVETCPREAVWHRQTREVLWRLLDTLPRGLWGKRPEDVCMPPDRIDAALAAAMHLRMYPRPRAVGADELVPDVLRHR